ncbi:hypothetical protein K461DRAFT_266694 [Myriangium duriaei CBS 260.36]|uniref:Uncharacterized protein n=1 Tax=Myriangium duriaei CBS 260.36 TaxID=1168546 RepID=A0A9P4JAR3_9PEZI|nr:hypothetical protein K461DRAFT_266694 [Myriangium duriaei CBS 260.36]
MSPLLSGGAAERAGGRAALLGEGFAARTPIPACSWFIGQGRTTTRQRLPVAQSWDAHVDIEKWWRWFCWTRMNYAFMAEYAAACLVLSGHICAPVHVRGGTLRCGLRSLRSSYSLTATVWCSSFTMTSPLDGILLAAQFCMVDDVCRLHRASVSFMIVALPSRHKYEVQLSGLPGSSRLRLRRMATNICTLVIRKHVPKMSHNQPLIQQSPIKSGIHALPVFSQQVNRILLSLPPEPSVEKMMDGFVICAYANHIYVREQQLSDEGKQ